MKLRWPFMLRSTHEDIFESTRQQNNFLRDAIREANNEIRKHRKLIAELDINPETLDRFMKAKAKL